MVKNNLDPSAQQWVRSIENRLRALEDTDSKVSESIRQTGVVLEGVTQTMSDLRAQQELISQQQVLLTSQQEALVTQQSKLLEQFGTSQSVPVLMTTELSNPVLTVTGSFQVTPPSWASKCQLFFTGAFQSALGGGSTSVTSLWNIDTVDVANASSITLGGVTGSLSVPLTVELYSAGYPFSVEYYGECTSVAPDGTVTTFYGDVWGDISLIYLWS